MTSTIDTELNFMTVKIDDGHGYIRDVDLPTEFIEPIKALIAREVAEVKEDLLYDLDEIDNKPWRAFRQLATIMPEYADEYHLVAEFYSNGGSRKIKELMADPAYNKNFPERIQQLKSKESK